MSESIRISETLASAVKTGQTTTSTCWVSVINRLSSVTSCAASLIVLLSFQLPAMIGLRMDGFFVLERDDARKRRAFEIFERSAAAGRDVRHLGVEVKTK